MADISKVTLLDGSVYDVKDSVARSYLSYAVIGTSVEEGVLKGQIPISALTDGLMITYTFPVDASGEFKLNLTYQNGVNTTGAIPIYGTRNNKLSGSLSAGATLSLVYYSKGAISINGIPTFQDRWICATPIIEFTDFGGDTYEEPDDGDEGEGGETSVVTKDSIYVVIGTHTTQTNQWTGSSQSITNMKSGTTIIYILPMDSPAEAVTLTLTTGDDTITAPVYINDETALTTAMKAGTSIIMTYIAANTTSFNGVTSSTDRWMCIGGATSSSSEVTMTETDNDSGGKTAVIG